MIANGLLDFPILTALHIILIYRCCLKSCYMVRWSIKSLFTLMYL